MIQRVLVNMDILFDLDAVHEKADDKTTLEWCDLNSGIWANMNISKASIDMLQEVMDQGYRIYFVTGNRPRAAEAPTVIALSRYFGSHAAKWEYQFDTAAIHTPVSSFVASVCPPDSLAAGLRCRSLTGLEELSGLLAELEPAR